MSSITDLMNRNTGPSLSKLVLIKIYEMVCIEDYDDEDIKDYCNYEADADEYRQQLIHEAARACKVFKAKCLLLRKQIPPPDEIDMVITRENNRITPRIDVHHVPAVTSITGANASTVLLDDIAADPTSIYHGITSTTHENPTE